MINIVFMTSGHVDDAKVAKGDQVLDEVKVKTIPKKIRSLTAPRLSQTQRKTCEFSGTVVYLWWWRLCVM